MKYLTYLFLLSTWILSGCASAAIIPTQTTTPAPTNTPAPTSTATITATPQPSPTATQTATITVTPTPTLDAETAARIEAIRAAVGDQPSDWIIFHDEIQPVINIAINKYELKLVYAGEDHAVKGKEILNGEGQAIGKVKNAFRGQILIGSELRELSFVYYYEEYSTGLCRMMAYDYKIECATLTEKMLLPQTTIERTGANYWNAVPGQVVSLYIGDPGYSDSSYDHFTTSFWAGREDLYHALIEQGDTSIGLIVPMWHKMVCDANNLYRVSFFCYKDPIIIPGY